MDLLEIRKKAKEQKEAAGRTQAQEPVAEAPEEAQAAPSPPPPPEAPPMPAKAKAKRKRKPAQKPAPGPEVEPLLEETTADAVDMPQAGDPVREEAAPEEVLYDEGGGDGAEDGEIVEYLAFMLANEEYAVKVEAVKEIIRLQKTTMVPRAPGFVEGIISLRGVIIPVFDIKKKLKLDLTDRTRASRIVVLSEAGSPQGIIVDKVTGVARIPAGGIEPPPAVIGGVEGEYIEGIGRLSGRLLILFNTDKVLAMEG